MVSMNVFGMAVREIVHRKLSFLSGFLAIGIATGAFVGAAVFLSVHEKKADAILVRKEALTRKTMASLKEEMRKASLELSFNVLILPEGQELKDFYKDDFAAKYMPEDYVDRLASSGTMHVQHILPSLQQKIRWLEKKRTIILTGTRGEVPNLYKDPRKPFIQPVPKGTIVLGHELHQSLGLKVGDKIKLMKHDFTVHRCHEERGNKDDITAWIFLSEAQELLKKKGQINSILALKCMCVVGSGTTIREVISGILPGTKVVEMGGKMLAREESRTKAGKEAKSALEGVRLNQEQLRAKREQFAAIAVPVILIACVIWVGLLAFHNVRVRRKELGVLRAIGLGSGQILRLVLIKALGMGLLGGGFGFLSGSLFGKYLGRTTGSDDAGGIQLQDLLNGDLLGVALVVAVAATVIATWLPALIASKEDPATVFRGE